MKNLYNEKSPPGWSGTIKKMKEKHPEIDNPYGLAWSMYNKGYKHHYKPLPDNDSNSKKKPKKYKKYKKKLKSFKEFLINKGEIDI